MGGSCPARWALKYLRHRTRTAASGVKCARIVAPRRIDGEGKLRTPEGLFSAPFSTGQRNCVGQALAMGQLKQVVAALAVRFVFEVVTPPTPDYFLTLKPSGAKLRAQSWSNAA